MSDALTIATIEDAAELIERLDSGSLAFTDEDFERLTVSSDLSVLNIAIYGPNFHGTVTGGLARGLWLLQKEIYQAAAFSIYGVDNYGKIPRSQLRDFTLVFQIDEGCTEAKANVWDLTKHVVYRAMDNMTPAQKGSLALRIVLGAAGICAVAYVGNSLVTNYFDQQKLKITTAAQVAADERKTDVDLASISAQVERDRATATLVSGLVNSDPRSARFDQATQEGVKLIAKTSPEATRLRVGRMELDASQLADLNARASREVLDMFTIRGFYRVTSTAAPTSDGIVRVGLSGNGDDFFAHLNVSDKDHPIDDSVLTEVFLGPKTGVPIYMEVRIKRDSDGVKEAFIEKFPPQETAQR